MTAMPRLIFTPCCFWKHNWRPGVAVLVEERGGDLIVYRTAKGCRSSSPPPLLWSYTSERARTPYLRKHSRLCLQWMAERSTYRGRGHRCHKHDGFARRDAVSCNLSSARLFTRKLSDTTGRGRALDAATTRGRRAFSGLRLMAIVEVVVARKSLPVPRGRP